MDQRTTGIILRTYPLTETSLLVNWLTFDLGRLATVAQGGRRPKSPFRGKLDLFYLADFSFAPSRRSSLHGLRELSLRETNSGLRCHLTYLQQASYCATLIERTTETETPLPDIASLFAGLLEHLPKRTPHGATVFAFEIKLWSLLGLSPDIQASCLSLGAKRILLKLLELDWPALSRIQFQALQYSELSNYLERHLTHQLGGAPRGRNQALGHLADHPH
jgi:DNA repair protein RecO (recombination protein O)